MSEKKALLRGEVRALAKELNIPVDEDYLTHASKTELALWRIKLDQFMVNEERQKRGLAKLQPPDKNGE